VLNLDTIVPADPRMTLDVSRLCHTIRVERRRMADEPSSLFIRLYVPTVAPVVATVALVAVVPAVWSWLLLVAVAGLTQNALGILTHEASHFFLHRNRRVNDIVADWLVCLPIFNTVAGYRRDHFEHHRGCCGPRDPYYGLYGPYERRSQVIRGFVQDVLGLTAVRSFLARYLDRSAGSKRDTGAAGRIAVVQIGVQIITVQGIIAAALTLATGQWWAYPVAWVAPLLTVPFAVNRVRTFVEHHAGPQEPEASRTTIPSLFEWIAIAPYGYAHHFEHHLMPDVPYYHLGWAHAQLGRLGFLFGGEHLSSGGYLRTFSRLYSSLQ
jgi:fatty acid desaturase